MHHPPVTRSAMFAYVKAMNEAFGNPPGDPTDFDPMPDMLQGGHLHYDTVAWGRLRQQCENIAGPLKLVHIRGGEQCVEDSTVNGEALELLQALEARNPLKVRDALCDIMVFALGAYHFLGYDADADMQAVLDGVMTRFCRNQAELVDTVSKWTRLGVSGKAEGDYPRMIYRSDRDQTSTAGEFIPKGKFLKSAGYTEPVFPPAPAPLPSPGATPRTFFGSKPAPAAPAPQRRKDDGAALEDGE